MTNKQASKKNKTLSPWFSPSELGFRTRGFLSNFGASVRLLLRLFATASALKPLVKQIFILGNRSLSIVTLCGLFVGFVLALQMYNIIQMYGAENMVGMATSFALLRELGPALTAILFAGRAGTSLTAEIGLMKSNDELTAMEMMAVDPVKEVLAPRFWGGIIALPLLTAIFVAIGVIGAYLVCVPLIGLDGSMFWSLMQNSIDVFHDVGNSLLKALVFGVAVTFVALWQGYTSLPTPEGVSRATTRTVVVASFATLALNVVLTIFMFMS